MIRVTIHGDGFEGRYWLTGKTARLHEQHDGVIASAGHVGRPEEALDAFVEYVVQGIRRAAPMRKPMAAETGTEREVRSA